MTGVREALAGCLPQVPEQGRSPQPVGQQDPNPSWAHGPSGSSAQAAAAPPFAAPHCSPCCRHRASRRRGCLLHFAFALLVWGRCLDLVIKEKQKSS